MTVGCSSCRAGFSRLGHVLVQVTLPATVRANSGRIVKTSIEVIRAYRDLTRQLVHRGWPKSANGRLVTHGDSLTAGEAVDDVNGQLRKVGLIGFGRQLAAKDCETDGLELELKKNSKRSRWMTCQKRVTIRGRSERDHGMCTTAVAWEKGNEDWRAVVGPRMWPRTVQGGDVEERWGDWWKSWPCCWGATAGPDTCRTRRRLSWSTERSPLHLCLFLVMVDQSTLPTPHF